VHNHFNDFFLVRFIVPIIFTTAQIKGSILIGTTQKNQNNMFIGIKIIITRITVITASMLGIYLSLRIFQSSNESTIIFYYYLLFYYYFYSMPTFTQYPTRRLFISGVHINFPSKLALES
jgi:hypothetical protein